MDQPNSRPAAAGRHAFAALILSNIFLAFGPWMVRLADVGPVAAGFWRLALAIPVLLFLAFGLSRESVRIERALVVMLAIGGLFFAADLASWHYGIVRTKLANATLFGNSASFIFAAYGFVLLRRLPGLVPAVALFLALAGTILLLGSSYEASPLYLVGDLFTILAGLFYTFYLIAVDRARRTLAPLPVLALSTVAGALPLLAMAHLIGEQVMPGDWTPVLALAIGSQVIGQGLLVYAVGHVSPVVVGLSLLTQPAVTALIGWLAYRETFTLTDLAGALLICAALVLIRLPGRVATSSPAAH